MNKVSIACIAVRDGKVLVARRIQKGQMGGRWEFPGGKVEEGENEQAAIVREMNEELGVEVTCGSYICSGSFVHDKDTFTLKAYEMLVPDSVDTASFTLTEHTETMWIDPLEIPSLSFVDSDMAIYAGVMKYLQDRTCL